MLLPITALYAGLLGIIAIALGAGSGLLRVKTNISIGGGDDPRQQLAFRRHGNFAEWVPITLILIGILELNQVGATPLHAMGAALVIARIAHPLGLKADTLQGAGRAIGAGLTTLVLLVASIWAIVTALS